MRHFYSTALMLLVLTNFGYAQSGGVSVNTQGTPADPSAIFDASSTTQGALFPRMNTAQRDAIPNPAKGLYIYNLDCDNVNFNAGTPETPQWVTLYSSNISQASVSVELTPAGGICEGQSITYAAFPENEGDSPIYQWKKNGVVVNGESGSIFFDPSPADGDKIVCILTSNQPCVAGSPASSPSLTIEVIPSLPAGISIVASPSGAICPDDEVIFTTTLSNSGSAPQLVWKKNGIPILGEAGSAFSSSDLQNGDEITCEMTSSLACVSSSPAISNTIVMIVNPVLTASVNVSASPGGFVCPGQEISFTATPVNGGLSPAYMWYINNELVSGVTSAVYSSSDFSDGDEVRCEMYSVQACVSGSPAVSNSVEVDVLGSGGSMTFTTCGATGRTGPNQAQANSAYGQGVITINEGIQIWQVPACVSSVTVSASGAQGGSALVTGGFGATMTGTFSVTPGELLRIVVGQKGASAGSESGQNKAGGGGGASYVAKVVSSGDQMMFDGTLVTPMIIAGGGAGSPYSGGSSNSSEIQGQSGNNGAHSFGVGAGTGGNGGAAGGGSDGGRAHGGGGFLTGGGCYDCGTTSGNGTGGDSFLNGSKGGYGYPSGSSSGIYGGFGGGGGGTYSGGGGGGYSGGAGGYATPYYTGGGGGSYNAGTSQTNQSGVRSGDGQVVITW